MAAHVQRAVAGVMQAKLQAAVVPGRSVATHVRQAVAGAMQAPAQARLQTAASAGRPPAAHVERAVAAPLGGSPAPAAPNRAAPAGAGGPVQRRIDYRDGTRVKSRDPMDCLLQFVDYGITPVIVNGLEIPPRSNAERLLKAPALLVDPQAETTAVSVASVAIQAVSYRMELPVDPPWERQNVGRSSIRTRLLAMLGPDSPIRVPIAEGEEGTVELKLKGDPGDETFARLVEFHEDFHVADLRNLVEEILKPWDAKLERMRDQDTRFEAASQQDAEAQLYAAAGGTPAEVGKAFVTALGNKGLEFHQSAAGASPAISRIERSTFGGTLRVYLAHPPALLGRWQARLREVREEQLRRTAPERSYRLWAANRNLGNVSITSEGGNPYILNEML